MARSTCDLLMLLLEEFISVSAFKFTSSSLVSVSLDASSITAAVASSSAVAPSSASGTVCASVGTSIVIISFSVSFGDSATLFSSSGLNISCSEETFFSVGIILFKYTKMSERETIPTSLSSLFTNNNR
ncbi:unnamed protein product [Chrysodeixis includens]|uniref:Secreted protein n=1 Tax=Chrysodeixis includens TaxID=689277 RepID=A0A9N8KZM5_CHRIL|nr:unnamed protein product [Chrysodeixis includens]